MTQIRSWSWAQILCIASALTLVACGDDDDDGQPGSVPTDVPGAVDSWSRIRIDVDCDDCPQNTFALTVRDDGTTDRGVTLTEGELNQLSDAADAVAQGLTDQALDCQEQDELEESYNIDLTLEGGRTVRVVQANRRSDLICTLGDRAEALQLRDVIRELADRYAGGTGPSPTPTVTSSPTSTPTPTPTFTTLSR